MGGPWNDDEQNPLQNILSAAQQAQREQCRQHQEQMEADEACFVASMATHNTVESVAELHDLFRRQGGNKPFLPGDVVQVHPMLNVLFRANVPMLVTEVREAEPFFSEEMHSTDLYGERLDTRVAFYKADGQTVVQQWVDRRRLVLLQRVRDM